MHWALLQNTVTRSNKYHLDKQCLFYFAGNFCGDVLSRLSQTDIIKL